jgi:hypothetical protein
MAVLVRVEWAVQDVEPATSALAAFAAIGDERRRLTGARGLVESLWVRRGTRLGLLLVADSPAMGDAYSAWAAERVGGALGVSPAERSSYVVLAMAAGAGHSRARGGA